MRHCKASVGFFCRHPLILATGGRDAVAKPLLDIVTSASRKRTADCSRLEDVPRNACGP